MEYPSFGPETLLALLHALLYSVACILAGASLIGLSVYIALLCSEMFFSQPPSKTPRAKVPQLAHRAPVAEGSHDLFAVEKRILAAPNRLGEEAEAVRVAAPAHGGQVPMTVPALWKLSPFGPEVSVTLRQFCGEIDNERVAGLFRHEYGKDDHVPQSSQATDHFLVGCLLRLLAGPQLE